MANMNFGVNILPKANNTYTLGNSDYKWANIFTNKINGTSIEEIIAGGASESNVGVITPTFTATSGYYISNTGVKSSSSNYSMSSPITVSAGDVISLIATGYQTSVAMISLSNSEGTTFTPVVISTDSNEHEYVYHATSNGYYIISYKSSNTSYTLTQYTKDSFRAIGDRIKDIEDLHIQGLIDDVKYNPLYVNVAATMSDSGHFIQQDGSYQSASAFNISSTITLPANSIIVFNARGYQDNVAILAQVKDNAYIPLIISEDSNEHTFSYITYDQINVLISSNKAVTPIYSIYSSRIDTLDGRVNNIESDLFAFTTMGVIGDSLANGSSNYSDGVSDNPNYSWGRCIERIYGTEVILFTKGGFTTQDWLTDPAGLPALQSEKALDCYVIGLGQNDAYSLGDAYLGTVSDISVGDESNNADSYYGNYSKIIAAIQTKSPNAKIFCLTNARPNSQTKLNYNSAIEDIVELYDNTYLVDLAADPFYSSSIFNDTWYGAHSTPAGYRLIAKNIHDNICKIIRQNIADFTDIQTWTNANPLSLSGLKSSIDTLSTSIPTTMTGATSSVAGSGGLVPAPATTDVDKFLAGDGTYKSGGLPMVILSYGNSTWQDFINAYNNNVIVYCRASSNSNPASGSQTRMAFMAYVNNATTPTEVEFQYYRSMSSHSATAMGDQVFVYKLTKTSGWSVTTRDASIKEINVASGSKLGVSWSSNKVTLSNTMTANDMPMSSSDATTAKSAIDTLNSNLSEYNISLNPNYVANDRTSAVHIGNRLIVAGTFITGTSAISTATAFGRIVKGSSTYITISASSATAYLIQSNDFTTPYYLQINSDGTVQPVVNDLKASTWFSFVIILNLA